MAKANTLVTVISNVNRGYDKVHHSPLEFATIIDV